MEMYIEKINDRWIIWQNGIKLMGFYSERSANSAYKKLLKNPNWRG